VDLAAINLGGVRVTEFMNSLDERIDEPEKKQVLRREGGRPRFLTAPTS
jgi:hypothetical protein